jgi:soluble calcium-activated nucleotidase 1
MKNFLLYPPSPSHLASSIGTHFRISLVADQDENSKLDAKTWHSWLRSGTLTLHKDKKVTVVWDSDLVELRSHISEKGRGVELSELVVFNGKLYTVDDRSGIGVQWE